MNGVERGKLNVPVTVKCDDALIAALDALLRKRENELGVPLSRGMFVRMLLEEYLGFRATHARARE